MIDVQVDKAADSFGVAVCTESLRQRTQTANDAGLSSAVEIALAINPGNLLVDDMYYSEHHKPELLGVSREDISQGVPD